MKKICIVGAGLFGTTLALVLSRNKNIKIDIYEKNSDIMDETSLKNQQRFHLGYHYPRSKKTVYEIKKSSIEFLKFYGKNIFGNTKNIYGISDKNSKISFSHYCKKINDFGLKINKKKFDIFSSLVSNSIITNEKNLNFFKLKKKISKKIKKANNIKLFLSKSIDKKYLSYYDKVIICTYSNNNYLLYKFGVKKSLLKKKRYELVEKIIVKMPKKLKKLSVVILDGNFLNFDPFVGTNYHLLSVVKEAKIEVVNAKLPNFKNPRKNFLKYKFIKNKKMSNYKKFINTGKKLIPELRNAKYIKSAYVVRCINKSQNSQDRKTTLNFYGDKLITVFSGKWNNCVKIAKEINKII